MLQTGVASLRRLLRSPEALTVLLFSGAQLVLGLGSSRLLTQVASPAALGEYYLYMNLAQWLSLPATSSYTYLWRAWPVARETGQVRKLVGRIRRGLTWQTAICLGGALCFAAAGTLRADAKLVSALVVVSSALAINLALDPIQTLERHRVRAGVLALLATPFRQIALSVTCVIVSSQSGAQLLATQAAYGVCTAAVSTALMATILRQILRAPDTARKRADLPRFSRFSMPFFVTGAVTQAAVSAERWGLATRSDTGATAIFVQAVAVSVAATGAATLPISTYFTPLIFQEAAQSVTNPLHKAKRPLRSFLVLTLGALLACTLLIGVLAGPVTTVFFGPRYRSIARLLPWTMSGQALFALSQAIALVPMAVESTVGLNVALVVSKMFYVALLLLSSTKEDYALWFSKCFAVSNLLYLVCMLVATAQAVRVQRARVAGAALDG